MKRIVLLLGALLSLASSPAAERGRGRCACTPVVWNVEHLDRVRSELARNGSARNGSDRTGSDRTGSDRSELYRTACDSLLAAADRWLTAANPSVMSKPQAPVSGDMHDYMSLSRYYWPDPSSADGLPWIQRDGVSNPALDAYDRKGLGDMCRGVQLLAVAHRLTGRRAYAAKARSLLRTWFLDPATRMNPNLEFSQVAMGHNGGNGRPSGCIDTYSFMEMLDAVEMLGGSGCIPASEMRALREWFRQLVEWMTSSELGARSRALSNNLGLAYDAQLMRFALFAGREDVAREVLDGFVERRLARQIKEDGSQPRELRRTKALHYSAFNIGHMLDVCAVGRRLGVDIYSGADRAVERAIDFLIPFLGDRKSFPYKQINEWDLSVEKCARLLMRASGESGRSDWRETYDRFHASPEEPLFVLLYM